MRKKRVGVIDILAKSPSSHSYSRMLRVNNMSIMPQIVAVWCEEDGHDVHYAYHDGPFLLKGGIPDDLDIIFINAFSQCAQLAYALSAYYRSKGIATALGGPHARSYPEDAVKYFDYVVGFADKSLISEIVQESAPHRPVGQHLYRSSQPSELPSLRQRWKYVELALEEAKIIRMIPMLGSVGCPYTCSFCIDAKVDYHALDLETIKEDLRFIRKLKMPRSIVIWHDPNFGIRFNDILGTIEEAIPPGSLNFLAECSLSILKEDNLHRFRKNGFKIIMPGIESWYDMGDKSKARNIRGMEKVKRVADQLNTVQSYIPYVQANLIFGLDNDTGSEPFELTKKFLDLAPGIYPHFALLTSFGQNAELNLGYQRENRVLGTPFHFLNLFHAMNVTPKNYTWSEFYGYVADTFDFAFGPRMVSKRFRAGKSTVVRIEQRYRAITSDRNHRGRAQHKMIKRLETEKDLRQFMEGETTALPRLFIDAIKKDLGPMWEWLPEGAMVHDPNAYLKATQSQHQQTIEVMAEA